MRELFWRQINGKTITPLAVVQQNHSGKKQVSIKLMEVHNTDEEKHYWAIDPFHGYFQNSMLFLYYTIICCIAIVHTYAITFKETTGFIYTVQYTSIEPFSCSLLIKNQINCRKEAELKCKPSVVLKCSTSESWRLFCQSGLQHLTHVLQARPFLNARCGENTMWPTFYTI